MNRAVMIKETMTSEQFGCQKEYFEIYIHGKPLFLIDESKNLIRVMDINNEEWTLFNGQFIEVSQLGLFE